MPIIYGNAPGKIILFGEHAVVYGYPAIAMPVTKVKATAQVYPELTKSAGWIGVQAPDINLDASLADLPAHHPISQAITLTLKAINPTHIPAMVIQVSSTIPIGGGMGSSAAITIAIMRGLSSYMGQPLSATTISDLAYEVEKIHHGTPSGIDNAVIAHQVPIFFKQEAPIELLKISKPTHWVIADTGETTPTKETVAAVRTLYEADIEGVGEIMERIGTITEEARFVLETGDMDTLGDLLNENQTLLHKLGVSCEKLDQLIKVARLAGAVGAKLSGGGRGGNMIALAQEDQVHSISTALQDAGATRVITTLLAERGVP